MKKRATPLKSTLAAAITTATLLAAGCSSSQKPATLGAAAGGAAGGASAASGGTNGGTPSGGASGAGTPTASGTGPGASGGASGAVPSSSSGPAPGTVISSPLPGGGGTFLGTVPADPNGTAALLVYQQFVTMTSQMSQTASYDKNLANIADLGALSTSENGVTQLRNQNVHIQGTMSAKATVTNVNMGAQPLPLVSITSCVDQSKWAFYYTSGAKKGQKAPYGVIPPYVVLVKVHKSADGKWRVTDVTTKDQKC